MPEAVMVVVDNSDYTRNGDYIPSRFAAQSDAVTLVCNKKTQSNIENCVGILASAGDRVEVMVTPTDDLGRMTAELSKVKIGGCSDLLRGIQTAQLALKHRQNKNQKQRIVVFVASPITATEKELETLGKNLKKNNVSLDLVSFGETEENSTKLDKLLNTVNSSDTSHLVTIPAGPQMIADVLISSPILSDGTENFGGGGGGCGGDGFDFGVDANTDPELALALRISMEEERARQAASENPPGETPAPTTGATTEPGTTPAVVPPPTATTEPQMATNTDVADVLAGMDDDMDEELRQALLLSMQESGPPVETPPAPTATEPPAPMATTEAPKPTESEKAVEKPEATKDVDMTEKPPEAAKETDGVELDSNWFQDPSFVSELLGSLPGVDVNDPRIQEALKSVGQEPSSDSKTDKKEDEDKK